MSLAVPKNGRDDSDFFPGRMVHFFALPMVFRNTEKVGVGSLCNGRVEIC
jgi:hypothetical protein